VNSLRLGGWSLVTAYRDAVAGRRLAWASPQIALVGAYVTFYVAGLIASNVRAAELPAVALAVILGLVGLLVGIAMAWRPVRPGEPDASEAWTIGRIGAVIFLIGLAAMAAYLIRIGDLPILRPSLEQARVEAAEEGGAALRVLGMLTIPGSWLLVAAAVTRRSPRGLAWAAVATGITTIAWIVTGNRAPAFLAVEGAVVIGILADGHLRLRTRGVAILAAIALVAVLAAGVIGAVRLASPNTAMYGPPVPTSGPPNYPKLTQIAIAGYLRVPIQNLRFTMRAVPERIGWRLGYTYLQPAITVLPGKQLTFDADLKEALNQHYAGGGTVPGLLGESYANFGPAGWFVVPFVLALVVTVLYRHALKAANPAWWALYGYVLLHSATGGIISGLIVASIFPVEALLVLGGVAIGLPWWRARQARRAGRAVSIGVVEPVEAGVDGVGEELRTDQRQQPEEHVRV
jgi:hypothetical protein